MAMGLNYPFDFDFSHMTEGELLSAASFLNHYDRGDLTELIKELARRLEKHIA